MDGRQRVCLAGLDPRLSRSVRQTYQVRPPLWAASLVCRRDPAPGAFAPRSATVFLPCTGTRP